MLKPADHFHGSDLETIEKQYGIRREDIISFSANVNPLGLSGQVKSSLSEQLDVITSYPDREYTSLRRAIGDYCDADYRHVIVGNGSTELISLMIQLRHPKKALVLGPTYSEYEREVILAGGSCTYFPLQEETDFSLDENALNDCLRQDVDMFLLCNPNNPTSSLIPRAQMRRILDLCKRLDIFVAVDETYIEFTEDVAATSSVPLTEYYNNLVVLRGVSKFFASPGLRLGYAVTGNEQIIRTVREKQNPWTVSSVADLAGRLLFSDVDYIRQTKELIFTERRRICEALSRMEGIRFYPPAANFILVHILKEDLSADELFDKAIRQGLMIRNCSTFPFLDHTYFRFCFMNPQDNDRLLQCISEFLL